MLKDTIAKIFKDMQKELSDRNLKILDEIGIEIDNLSTNHDKMESLFKQTNDCLSFMDHLLTIKRVMNSRLRAESQSIFNEQPNTTVSIQRKDFENIKNLLTIDGSNSKKQVLKILRHY